MLWEFLHQTSAQLLLGFERGSLNWHKPITNVGLCSGLRDDFGVRVKSALEAMRESGLEKPGHVPRKGQGKLSALQKTNQGVQDRAQKDRENLEVCFTMSCYQKAIPHNLLK